MKKPNCPYKYLFGKPNEGLHAYRFMNVAIIDVLMTVIVAFILSNLFAISFWKVLGSLFILGIVLHRLFCVPTTVDKLLFPHAYLNRTI